MKTRRKKNRKKRQVSAASTLLRTLGMSFLVHVAVLYLIPSVDILAPAPEYIEIDATLLDMAGISQEYAEGGSEDKVRDASKPLFKVDHIPTALEPIAPEMITNSDTDPAGDIPTPKVDPQFPASLEGVKLPDPLKTSAYRLGPEPLKNAFASLRNVSKESSIPVNPEDPSVDRKLETPDEVTTTAEQPYEDVVVIQRDHVAAQELMPEFARSAPEELHARNDQQMITTPITEIRSTVGITPPVLIKRSMPSMKQLQPVIPRLQLPEVNDLPETPLDDVVTQANEIDISSETDLTTSSPPDFPEEHIMFPTSNAVLHQEAADDQAYNVTNNLSDRVRPTPPGIINRHIQTIDWSKAEMPRLQLFVANDPPETPLDDVVTQANEIDISSETDLTASSPADLPEEQIRFPESDTGLSRTVAVREREDSLTNFPGRERMTAILPERLPAPEPSQAPPSKKMPAQAMSMTQKLIPSFQNFSSVPGAMMVQQQNVERTVQISDAEEEIRTWPEISRAENFELSSLKETKVVPVIASLRSRQVSQRVQPPVPSTALQLTTGEKERPIETPFSPKEVFAQAEESVLQAVQLPVSDQSPAQNSLRPETSDEPRRISLAKNRKQVAQLTSARVSQPAQIQRSAVFGGEMTNVPLRVERPPFGLFARKEEPTQEFELPRKILHQDDSIKQATIQQPEEERSPFEIEGPASKREVIYKPLNLPRLNIDMEVDIRLKFWVLPNGTVGEVLPLQRGDVRLERAAIQYLKSWRFTPVDSSRSKVWGIIPITYKLR